MNDSQILIDLIEKKEKLTAMIAPSFPIVYEYPSIISMLRMVGFNYVVEVSLGAKKTNEELAMEIKKNPNAKFITSPCPSIVRFIKKQFPHLTKYLALNVDSPMIATAKIVKEKFPGYKPIFIGPCFVKKLEAKEDYPELGIHVVTYLEMDEVFKHFNIEKAENGNDKFDLAGPGMTRIYPTDGGLAHSGGLNQVFNEKQLKIVSGWQNCLKAINEFESDPDIKILDILYCEGGCIGGPGIRSNLTIEERKNKVFNFWLNGKI